MPISKYSKEYKINFIEKNLNNIISVVDDNIIYKCPVCNNIITEYFSKTFNRIYKKDRNAFEEDNKVLTCPNKSCSQKQAQKRKSVRNKIETTNLKKYGYKTFLETKESHKMAYNALIKKYGSISNAVKEGQKTYFEKTGFTHNMRNPKSIKLNQEHRIKTIKNMTKEKKYKWYENRLKSHKENGTKLWGGVLPKSTNCSKQQIIFFKLLSTKINDNIIFGQNNEYIISVDNKQFYKVDGYIPSKNVVIEYNGDFWHANPQIYEGNLLINYPHKKKYAKEIWSKDKQRLNEIKHILNCKIIIVWEYDFINNEEKTLKKVIGEIYE